MHADDLVDMPLPVTMKQQEQDVLSEKVQQRLPVETCPNLRPMDLTVLPFAN